MSQGMAMALGNLIASLKARRLAAGLSIVDVARRSRLTAVTVGELESIHNRNPSFDTVFRYGMALDVLITLGFEEIEGDDEPV